MKNNRAPNFRIPFDHFRSKFVHDNLGLSSFSIDLVERIPLSMCHRQPHDKSWQSFEESVWRNTSTLLQPKPVEVELLCLSEPTCSYWTQCNHLMLLWLTMHLLCTLRQARSSPMTSTSLNHHRHQDREYFPTL